MQESREYISITRRVSWNVKFLFESPGRARTTCTNPRYQLHVCAGICPGGERAVGISDKKCPLPKCLWSRSRTEGGGRLEEEEEERPLQICRTRRSDSNKRSAVPTTFNDTKFGGIVRAKPGWADSCFPGSRPPEASRSNKTISYDLYL